ncbi:MFS transporter [Streptomyces sp. NPDC001599]|uniref:MFS transporter n=1 Tax=Streptomyces sp. NPDC001599 TaxID=3364591 RepID=UPI003682D095
MTDAKAAPEAGTDASGFDRGLLPPMLLGSVLNPINSTIIAVALVPIGRALGAPASQTAWLVSALYLATSLGQPVAGRLVDVFGPRRLFLLSTGLVGVAGVVGALAPSLGVLIGARVLLGFGTCAGYPAAMALVRSEAERTGRHSPGGVLTALAVANQTVAVVGPLLGGLLIAVGGWRATFALNVPLALAAVLLGLLRLPKAEPVEKPTGGSTGRSGGGSSGGSAGRSGGGSSGGSTPRGSLAARLDLPGMGLFAAMLVALLLFLMNPHLRDWYLLALAAAAGAAFAARELRAATPFIDLRVLGGNTPLLATYGRALVAYVVAYSFLYGFTQWTEEGFGLSPFHAGLAQIPMFLLAIGISILSGRSTGVRGKLLLGAVGQIAACLVILTLGGDSPLWMLLLVALIFGVPQGLNNLALQNSVYFQAAPERTASSAGLLRTFAYIGSMVASSATASSFGQHADTGGLHRLAWVMLGAGVLYLLLTLFDRTLGRAPGTGTRAPV